MRTIDVAKDFSRSPAGRFPSDGPYSGELFRESLLGPLIREGEPVEVRFAGVLTMGSSFLEEAFGGLVRFGFASREQLRKQLKIESALKTYENRIWNHIDAAVPGSVQK